VVRKRLLFLSILLLITFNILAALNLNTTVVSAVKSPAIYIEPATTVNSTLTPDKNYTISIKTDYNGTDIQSWQFTLSYNPDILHGVSVTNGDLITKEKDSSAQFLPGAFDNTAGTLSLTAAFFFFFEPAPAPITYGPGTLANVTFTVVGVEESSITIGPETKLIGYTEDGYGVEYYIIDAATMPDHIQHGYFDNRGAPEIHDVAVDEVTAPAETIAGKSVNISVILRNQGTEDESVNVTVSYDSTVIDTATGIMLEKATSKAVQFSWDTPPVTANTNYNITAEIPPVTGEIDTADNKGTTLIKLVARHDVSVKDGLEAPTTAIIGELININATVENQGSFDENVNVAVKVSYGGVVIGTIGTIQNLTLKALTSTTIQFNWTTTDLAPGTYRITANAAIEADEDSLDNTEICDIKLMLGHDVVVRHISAPTEAFVGELVNIRVFVVNEGGHNETFEVKVTVSHDITVIETQTKNVTLLLGTHPTEDLFFKWNTTGVAPASYNITAKAILDKDVKPYNNLKSVLIDVESPPGTIAGTITDASTKNPMDGATVTANGYSTTTDTEGHYIIVGIPAGDYNITASAAGYYSNSTTKTVIPGGVTTVNLTLTPLPGAIAGTVTDALTGNPIEGANVTANGHSATTDTEGHYTIQLPPRTYNVTASATKYISHSKTATVTSETTTSLNFTLIPLNGTISGKVTDSSTGNPIAGATVTANGGISVSTGTDGTYSIELPPGNHNVTVSANGYEGASKPNITVIAGETTTVNFELTPIQPLNILLYAGVAAMAIIIIAAIAFYTLKIRKPKST